MVHTSCSSGVHSAIGSWTGSEVVLLGTLLTRKLSAGSTTHVDARLSPLQSPIPAR